MPFHVTPDERARFWGKVECREEYECWPWLASITQWGYGQHWFKQQMVPASKVAYVLTYGEIVTTGLCVLHRCDNRACCNPSHMFLGTKAANTRDMVKKGRARGRDGESRIEIACPCGVVFREWASQHRRFCSRPCSDRWRVRTAPRSQTAKVGTAPAIG